MVKAAEQHGRVVQVGTQRRSSAPTREVIDLLHSGELGRVYSARATYAANRGSIGAGMETKPPAQLDYDLWQGPAPRRPFTDNRIHYNWHWFWHWGNGELGNNGVHAIDLCRWGLQVDFPTQVTSCGGRFCFDDDQETADTHTVAFKFDDEKLITWDGHSCNAHEAPFVSFYGEKGAVDLNGDGTYRVYDADGKPLRDGTEKNVGDLEHIENFVAAVRAEDPGLLNCGIKEAYPSTQLCHLGNIAQRTGRALRCYPADGRVMDDAEAMAYWVREYEPGWEPKV
jgi:predicted dehydrogenase